MPKVITVMNSKGGAGKTTSIVNLAASLAQTDRVAVADCDPQKSIASWFAGKKPPFTVQAASLRQIASLPTNPRARQFGYILIDTPAGVNKETASILADISDLVIVPSRCSLLDVEPAIELSKTLALSGTPYKLLLTQVAGNRNSVDTVKRMLHQRNLPFFKSVIRQLEAHVQAALSHQTVYTMGSEARAARWDFDQLQEEVNGLLGVTGPSLTEKLLSRA